MWRKGRGFVKEEGRICEGRENYMLRERKGYVKRKKGNAMEERICEGRERIWKGRGKYM